MNEIENNRTELYLQFDDLFQDGTFKTIYQGEKTDIINVAGQFLAAIPYTDKLTDDSFAFISINENEAKEIVRDESIMGRIIQHRVDNGKIAPLNQKTKQVLQNMNAKRFDEGVYIIPPELEQEILGAKRKGL